MLVRRTISNHCNFPGKFQAEATRLTWSAKSCLVQFLVFRGLGVLGCRGVRGTDHNAIMTFASRQEAGQKLGQYLSAMNLQVDWVLGLPRGGVIVAVEVARALKRPLDALVVRKIGHPWHREFAVGAMAEDGTVVLDEEVLRKTGVHPADLEEVFAEERKRLGEYHAKFHRPDRPGLERKGILIVDDGLATGATTEAAVRSAKAQGAIQVLVTAPVASVNAVERLERVADRVLALWVDPDFEAVGRYYRSFPQTTDAEVQQILLANT
jgi:predicted phosphoribosyltransferase